MKKKYVFLTEIGYSKRCGWYQHKNKLVNHIIKLNDVKCLGSKWYDGDITFLDFDTIDCEDLKKIHEMYGAIIIHMFKFRKLNQAESDRILIKEI